MTITEEGSDITRAAVKVRPRYNLFHLHKVNREPVARALHAARKLPPREAYRQADISIASSFRDVARQIMFLNMILKAILSLVTIIAVFACMYGFLQMMVAGKDKLFYAAVPLFLATVASVIFDVLLKDDENLKGYIKPGVHVFDPKMTGHKRSYKKAQKKIDALVAKTRKRKP